MHQQSGSRPLKIAVAQLGARMHYAVPVLLDRAGMLEHFYTDAFAGTVLLKAARAIPPAIRPAAVKRLLGRSCAITPGSVTSFFSFGVSYRWRQRTAQTTSDLTAAYLWAGEQFNRLIIRSGGPYGEAVYGFHSASRELFRHCRQRGARCVLEQTIAPRRIQERIRKNEVERWPGWEAAEPDRFNAAYADREAEEWDLADLIMGASDFVIQGLAACGARPEKCAVVPYGVDTKSYQPSVGNAPHAGPLRVLFVGAVGLRKGVPYLLEAARKAGNSVRVRIVGPVCCKARAIAAACPQNVEIVGAVPRAEVAWHFAWADAFCLPSLCEGSATVTYEALASGLPVICTPNTGSVVVDGRDGFVVPIRDSDAVADRLARLAADRALLAEMSCNARSQARNYSWEQYARRLVGAITAAADAW